MRTSLQLSFAAQESVCELDDNNKYTIKQCFIRRTEGLMNLYRYYDFCHLFDFKANRRRKILIISFLFSQAKNQFVVCLLNFLVV